MAEGDDGFAAMTTRKELVMEPGDPHPHPQRRTASPQSVLVLVPLGWIFTALGCQAAWVCWVASRWYLFTDTDQRSDGEMTRGNPDPRRVWQGGHDAGLAKGWRACAPCRLGDPDLGSGAETCERGSRRG